MHKLKDRIISHLEEDIKEFEKQIEEDKKLLAELKSLEQKPVKTEPEKETDVVDDYAESMDEFIKSLGGHNPEQKEKKPEEIKALG